MSSAPSNGSNSDKVQDPRPASPDSDLSQVFTSRFNALASLMFLAVANIYFAREIVWILSIFGLMVAFLGAKLVSKPLKVAAILLYVCAALALFSPMDVFFRQGDGFSCQVVPIYYIAGTAREKLVSELRRQGKLRNRDYVIERVGMGVISWPTSALLITYPGDRSDPGQQ